MPRQYESEYDKVKLTPCVGLLLCIRGRTESVHVQRTVNNSTLAAPALAHVGLRIRSFYECRPFSYGGDARSWDGASIYTKRRYRHHLDDW